MNDKQPSDSDDQFFYGLTPDHVLDAIESTGLLPQAALLALNSYENRVYQFRDDDNRKYVAKFYRPNRWSDSQILEEHEFSIELAKDEIPVIAPLEFDGQTLLKSKGFRFALFDCHGGRTPELEDKKVLEWIGRFIGRIHARGSMQPFHCRPSISIETYAIESVNFLQGEQFLPSHIAVAYDTLANQLIDICENRFEQLGNYQSLRLHGDCHPSNLLWTDDGPHFVDFDDARQGPAVQDLWMLLSDSGDRELWNALLCGYEDFMDFDDRQLTIVEPLRTIRMIHYSAWLARRWEDPSFKHNFPWFNTNRYWEEHLLSLKEQLALMQNTPY